MINRRKERMKRNGYRLFGIAASVLAVCFFMATSVLAAPKGKLKSYRKLLKSKGQKKSVKIQ